MNFLVNFRDFSFTLWAHFLRKANVMRFIYVMVRPLKELNADITYAAYVTGNAYAIGDLVTFETINYKCKNTIAVAPAVLNVDDWIRLGRPDAFVPFRNRIADLLLYNAQIINLEQYLNNQFDPSNRGIYIDNQASSTTYKYQVEEVLVRYKYNIYDNAQSYVIGEYSDVQGYVFVCSANTTGNTPFDGSTFWNITEFTTHKYNVSESASVNYIIHIPLSVTYTKSNFRGKVDQFNLAGKLYTLVQP